MDEDFWNARYDEDDRVWSGDPNGALVDEMTDVAPGRALDLGSGEGDDARWLAARGWEVTAVDISSVAIDRARALGAAGSITWERRDVAVDGPPSGPFDLVSMQYFPMMRVEGDGPMRALLDVVAPGGTLLWVAHDMTDIHRHQAEHAANATDDEPRWRGPDLDSIYHTDHVVALLGDEWAVVRNELRPRRHSGVGGGAHHVNDVVLRAARA
ncbi:class I SAM-dependent methyltransferase [Williamsia herbipolensis]|uniref:class I SAM-dependent methyltransferase n=1 Tax=Williamsia herbipolensis TaxID=1603258 RepID=UPI0005F858DA|nr:class I SAM-dependent methyltransferase [Williamsia herbipolensis]